MYRDRIINLDSCELYGDAYMIASDHNIYINTSIASNPPAAIDQDSNYANVGLKGQMQEESCASPVKPSIEDERKREKSEI